MSVDHCRGLCRATGRCDLLWFTCRKSWSFKSAVFTILLFVAMDISCLFAWSGMSLLIFRFLQGVGTGGEVPVASAYINEFIGAEKRGKFFLLYEVLFPLGLMFAGMAAFFLMPIYGWKVMFIVGLIPSLLVIPLRFSCLSHHAGWLQKVVLKKRIKSLKALKTVPSKAVKLWLNLWLKKLTHKAWQNRLARAVPWHLPQTYLYPVGHVVLRVYGKQRHGDLAAISLQTTLWSVASNQFRLWLDYLGRGCDCLYYLH